VAASESRGSVARAGAGELALGFLFVIASNAAYFDARIVGINDTFYNFANFQIFYSELFFHGDLARWYPYGSYGLQADYEQIASLSPLSYLAGGLGALLRVPDALWLFKLAVLGEQLVFVFGVWRLGRMLFATPATVRVLTLAAAGTTVWYAQQWWDLRIYALLPLLLSFLFAFADGRRARDLWLAGLTGAVWSLGGLPYWIPLWVLTLTVIGAVAVRDRRATLRALVHQTPRELALLGVFVVGVGAYVWFLLHALDGTVLRAIGRDPLTGQVILKSFRSYGGSANLVVVANALLFGWPLHLPWGSWADNSVYLGLVPVLGLGVALRRERSRPFLALLAGVFVLVWLAMGGVFTTLVYYLPGFAYFRHVSLTFGLVKVLLLIASGYGLERLFTTGGPRLATPALWLITAVIALELLAASPQLFGPKSWQWLDSGGAHVLVRLGIYGALLAACSITRLPRHMALALGLALDLALYQLAIYQTLVPKLRDPALLEATAVRATHFQAERRDVPADPARPDTDSEANRASRRALELAERTGSRELYWYVYQQAQLDPCHGRWRTDYYQVGVDRLLGLVRANEALLRCGLPKLRIVADARIASSPNQARDWLREASGAADPAPTVIQLAAGSEAPPASGAATTSAGRALVLRFTLGELVADVEVDARSGAWLVYDDAFHAGWRASVNGAETPVHVANLAWKAVRVPPGKSRVRFWFHHGANHFLGSAIAVFGVASGAGLVGWMVASLVPRRFIASGRGRSAAERSLD